MYVSGTRLSNGSRDDADCLIQPEKTLCSTLSFILTNIIKEMLWIDTIFINNYTSMDHEMIKLPRVDSNTQRSITITCTGSCHLESDLIIFADAFHRTTVIAMENITFSNFQISVGNVQVKFRNALFLNSTVTDWKQTGNSFAHLVLDFTNTTFVGGIHQKKSFGLVLHKTFSATVVFTESILTNISTQLNTSHLFFQSRDTSYISTHIVMNVDVFCFTSLENVLLSGLSYTELSLVEISSNKLSLYFTNCTVDSYSGGFKVTKQESGLLDSWLQAQIQNCTFKDNRKLGSGAAVEIYFFPKEQSAADLTLNFLQIQDCMFEENQVDRKGSVISQGGAISIDGPTTEMDCLLLDVHIERSFFKNNWAIDGGGAVHIADSCFRTSITNSTFEITDQGFDSPKAIFVSSNSEISVESSMFSRALKGISPLSPSLLELEMLSERAKVNILSVTLQCPPWYRPSLETEFINTQAKEILATCTSCSANTYVLSDGKFDVVYQPNSTTVTVQARTTSSEDFECKPCPAGANCPGNEFTAKANFWGFTQGSQVTMHQCPADYCCTENCMGYDQCSGYRTGVLCGSCEEHYSLSILSSECINVEACKDHWLWPLVVLAVIMYMIWYTFKNDIFRIPVYIAKKLCKMCFAGLDDADVYYIDKGYFGIVTYFVQIKAVMGLSISLDHTHSIDKIFNEIESFIELVLNFELSYISRNTCVLIDLTTAKKMIFRLLFLTGIFLAWGTVYLCVYLGKCILVSMNWNTIKLETFQLKLISGLVEIVKYTYLGFSSAVFYSLTCTSIAGNNVWFHDGSVQCYNIWQIAMIIFCLLYIFPYPLLVYLGMKLLNKKKISQKSFFMAIIFPLPVVICWLVLSCQQNNEEGQVELLIRREQVQMK